MYAIYATICALFILWGLEIRYKDTTEQLKDLKDDIAKLLDEIADLKAQLKMKRNIYES